MTIDQKLREASTSVREARNQATFTVQAPGRSRPLRGGSAALAAVAGVLVIVGLPLAVFSGMSEPTGNAAAPQAPAASESQPIPGFIVVGYVANELDAPPQGLVQAVAGRPEATAVVVVDRAMSEAEARELYADDESFLRILDEQPGLIPASLRVRVDTQAQANELSEYLSQQPGVYGVESYHGSIDALPDEWALSAIDDSPATPTTTVPSADPATTAEAEGKGSPLGRPLTAERPDSFANITSENPYGSSTVFTELETAFTRELEGSTLDAWIVELATPEHRYEAADYTLPDGSRFRLAWRDSLTGHLEEVGTSRLPGAPDGVRYYTMSDGDAFEVRWMTNEQEGTVGFYNGATIPNYQGIEEIALRHYEAVLTALDLSVGEEDSTLDG